MSDWWRFVLGRHRKKREPSPKHLAFLFSFFNILFILLFRAWSLLKSSRTHRHKYILPHADDACTVGNALRQKGGVKIEQYILMYVPTMRAFLMLRLFVCSFILLWLILFILNPFFCINAVRNFGRPIVSLPYHDDHFAMNATPTPTPYPPNCCVLLLCICALTYEVAADGGVTDVDECYFRFAFVKPMLTRCPAKPSDARNWRASRWVKWQGIAKLCLYAYFPVVNFFSRGEDADPVAVFKNVETLCCGWGFTLLFSFYF